MESFVILLLNVIFIYRENFDDESPFHPDTVSQSDRTATGDKDSQIKLVTCEEFQEKTKELFNQMINEIKVCLIITTSSIINIIQCVDCVISG